MTRNIHTTGLLLAGSCLTMVVALLVVGLVSHGVLRHIVQTGPLWIPIVLGTRRAEVAKWAALPSFTMWFLLMVAIWLFLLGRLHLFSGTFTPIEIAMTIVVGGASIVGFATCVRTKTATRPVVAIAVLLGIALLDVLAMRLSFLPSIAHR